MKLRFIDLFGAPGGMSLGMKMAGLLPVAALAAAIFHLGWLGALFSAGGAAWAAGAALAPTCGLVQVEGRAPV